MTVRTREGFVRKDTLKENTIQLSVEAGKLLISLRHDHESLHEQKTRQINAKPTHTPDLPVCSRKVRSAFSLGEPALGSPSKLGRKKARQNGSPFFRLFLFGSPQLFQFGRLQKIPNILVAGGYLEWKERKKERKKRNEKKWQWVNINKLKTKNQQH